MIRGKKELPATCTGRWVDEVLMAARRKPAMVKGDWRPAEAETPAPVVDDVEQAIPSVGEPAVVWIEGRVEFAAGIQDEVDAVCSSDRYFVSVDDEPKALFVKQPDGRFARAGGTGRDIQFAVKAPNASVAITDGTSEPVAVELVSLFNPDADLEAWAAGTAGRSRHVDVETHSFEPSRSYTFRMPLDAIVEPSDAVAHQWTCDAHKWVLVPGRWPDNLRILLDDAELFAAGELTREPVDAPAWVGAVAVRLTDIDWERATFRLRVSVPTDVRVLGARVFGKAIRFGDCDSRTFKSAPISIELHDAKGSVDVRLALMNGGDRRVIRHKENLPLEGLLLNHEGLWQRHGPDRELNVGTFRRKTCLVHLPNPSEENGRPWVAIQGYREVGVPTNRPGQVRDLAGWGQPLELAEGRYNRPAGDPRLKLASRVIDRGCVLDLLQLAGSADVIVRLQDPIEPSSEHCLVVWTSEGHLISIGRDDISMTQDGRAWQFNRSACGLDYSGSIIAVAAAYRGKRLGAWWTDDWCRFVRYHVGDGHAGEAAALLRWFQFPVLDERDAGTIRALAADHGLAFAKAWLLWRDDGTSWQATGTERIAAMENLRPPTADPAWYEVVREVLAGWNPQPEDAEQLVTGFEQIESDLKEFVDRLPLASLVERVAEAAPLLTGRLVWQWLSNKTEFASQAKPLLGALANQIRPRTNEDRHGRDAEDFDPRVNGLRLSRPFTEQLLETARSQSNGDAVDGHAAENLQTLLQHPNVSRLVAAHLLESLEPSNNASHVTT